MCVFKFSVILCGYILSAAVGISQSTGHRYLLVSGYTKALPDKGIAVYDFNTQTGELKFHSVTGGIENPSYLAVSRNGKYVYAVSEKNKGTVVAYRFDHISGKLDSINQSSAGGRGPCYISTDDAATHVFIANYSDGSLSAIKLNTNGSLDTTAIQTIQHSGSSINKDNQAGPHVHSMVLSPDNRYVLCADLGIDHVYTYRFDAKSASPLSEAVPAYVDVKPGSGPRHICFHPNGNYVYVVNELNGTVDAFSYSDGKLQHKQTITMLPEGFNGIIEAADIHISPDGKFLYASNREERNEIIIYSIGKDGTLRFAGRQSVMGAAPRNFVIDPSGKFVLVANQNSNEVIVFRRNKKTGLLKYSGKKISTASPSCLKFITVH